MRRSWLKVSVQILVVVLVVVAARRLLRPGRKAAPAATAFRAYLADPGARMVAYSPGDEVRNDPQRLTRQLTMLRTKFDGVALYGCTPTTPLIVETARALGYKAVLLTIWSPRSEPELSTAASIVRDEAAKMAVAVSVGSEGLMEKRYSVEDLLSARQELLDRNEAATSVEMTTTEPWWLYLRAENKQLREFGEFTSVNIHVVWDTDIVDPALAASWTRDRAAEVQQSVGRPLLVREAGLPGEGTSPRQGMGLKFTRQMQAGFWHSWLELRQKPPLVAFEGVDNGGKHWQDFEGGWGLLDATLKPWPAWEVFPVLEESHARAIAPLLRR